MKLSTLLITVFFTLLTECYSPVEQHGQGFGDDHGFDRGPRNAGTSLASTTKASTAQSSNKSTTSSTSKANSTTKISSTTKPTTSSTSKTNSTTKITSTTKSTTASTSKSISTTKITSTTAKVSSTNSSTKSTTAPTSKTNSTTKNSSTTKLSNTLSNSSSTSKTSSKTTSTSKSSTKSLTSVPITTTSSTKTSSTASSSTKTTSSSTQQATVPALSLSWKGGLSGFPGITTLDVFTEEWMPYISWYSNYEPVAANMQDNTSRTIVGAPMLWGKGDQCLTGPDGPVDAWRLGNFTEYVETGDTDPEVFFGFYEPDCDCNSSSHIVDVSVGVEKWNALIKPLAERGIKLGSPPMCTQLDQTWLTEFNASGVTWDITSIHVNKPTAAEGMEVVEYYTKFGKPVWVSELTCVDDQNWTSCGNQTVVNTFITEMVQYLEANDNVIAYGANTGEGVPGLWNLMTDTSPQRLSATGEHYQAVLKALYT